MRDEAELLLAHVLRACEPGWCPPPAMLLRYVEALRARGVSERPVLVPRGRRVGLAALDAATRLRAPRGWLQRKLLIAAAVVECDPASAGALLPRERSQASFFAATARALARAAWAIVASTPFLVSGKLLRRHVRP